MWDTHNYVYVNSGGCPTGFDTPAAAIDALFKYNMPWGRDSEKMDYVQLLIKDDVVRIDEHNLDCSPRHAAVFFNKDKLPIESFVNAHLWSLPLSMDYLRSALAAWEARPGPRVGDYCFEGKKCTRFTHSWGDELQTGGGNASFHMSKGGLVSYSGGLDPAVPADKLEDTCIRRWGAFWFFKDGFSGAHRGIEFITPVRVYRRIN